MSDNLRDRIAAVLKEHQDESDAGPDCTCGWEWQGYPLWKDSYVAHVADAVIEALGLKHEKCFWDGLLQRHRYVTEWTTDA